jgi:hypothetical protein
MNNGRGNIGSAPAGFVRGSLPTQREAMPTAKRERVSHRPPPKVVTRQLPTWEGDLKVVIGYKTKRGTMILIAPNQHRPSNEHLQFEAHIFFSPNALFDRVQHERLNVAREGRNIIMWYGYTLDAARDDCNALGINLHTNP